MDQDSFLAPPNKHSLYILRVDVYTYTCVRSGGARGTGVAFYQGYGLLLCVFYGCQEYYGKSCRYTKKNHANLFPG